MENFPSLSPEQDREELKKQLAQKEEEIKKLKQELEESNQELEESNQMTEKAISDKNYYKFDSVTGLERREGMYLQMQDKVKEVFGVEGDLSDKDWLSLIKNEERNFKEEKSNVVMADVAYLSLINKLGHNAGDKLLTQAGQVFKDSEIKAFRHGGDEISGISENKDSNLNNEILEIEEKFKGQEVKEILQKEYDLEPTLDVGTARFGEAVQVFRHLLNGNEADLGERKELTELTAQVINRLKKEIKELDQAKGSGDLQEKFGNIFESGDRYEKFDFSRPDKWAEKEIQKREEKIKELEKENETKVEPKKKKEDTQEENEVEIENKGALKEFNNIWMEIADKRAFLNKAEERIGVLIDKYKKDRKNYYNIIDYLRKGAYDIKDEEVKRFAEENASRKEIVNFIKERELEKLAMLKGYEKRKAKAILSFISYF